MTKTSPAFEMRLPPYDRQDLPAAPAAVPVHVLPLPPQVIQLLNDGPPMYVADLDGKLIYASPRYRRLLDLRARKAGVATDRPGSFALGEIICEIAVLGQPLVREDVVEANGTTEFYSSQHFPIHDEAGKTVAVGGIYQNATREAQAWIETLAARDRFRDIARLVSDWIWETDAKFDFTFVSPRVTEVLKLHPRNMIGTNLFALGTFRAPQGQIQAKPLDAGIRSPFRDAPFEAVTGDGERRLFLISGVPVFEDKTGAFRGYRGTARDITEETETRRIAARSQRRLTTAIENITEGFALRDGRGRIALFNARLQDFFSVAAGSLRIGGGFADVLAEAADGRLVADGSAAALQAWIAIARANSETLLQPFELALRDGRWIKISESRTAKRGVVTIVSDITPTKQREEALIASKQAAEEASRFKGEFLANMSHELRTPLNAIIGFSEIMQSQTFGPLGNDRYLDYAKDILDSSRHLLGIINDILDVSKAEAGKLQLNESDVDVAQAVRDAVRLFAEQAAEQELTLSAEVPDGLPPLWADARKIKQILLNLLSNALKFTPPGGRVAVTLSRDGDGGDLLIRIADSGIGIDAKDMDKVFAAFGQVESSLSRRYEGTGLGLPLSVALVEMHDGKLTLQSQVGVGTTVEVRLPAERLRRAHGRLVAS